jgi:UDP-N-acetylglucosamine/UDP-N-acetylgalactosamine diphosphorylase
VTTVADAGKRLAAAGQGHLVRHAGTLPPAEGDAFLRLAATQPWDELRAVTLSGPPPAPPELRPPQALTWRRQESVGGLRARLGAAGAEWLKGGAVATLLLAGGQGTRLGHAGPKGTYALGPDPDRTLFAVLAEGVAAVGRRAGRAAPWVVLTSPETDAATRAAFAAGGASWGLAPGQVRFVVQGCLPALDFEGRALLAGPGRLALAPDGHGGAFAALAQAGLFDDLLQAGVRVLTTFQVDNPLSLPLDPVLLGWMRERGAQAVSKAVRKRHPTEALGVFARDLDGRTRIVEYTELDGVGGAEALVLGSIAIHAFDLRALAEIARRGVRLPLHAARKRVPYLDDAGRLVTPTAPNAVKAERFLFDLLPLLGRVEVHEVLREREFAPLKNATGEHTPEEARALAAAEVLRWHKARGLPEPARPALRPLDLFGDGRDGLP